MKNPFKSLGAFVANVAAIRESQRTIEVSQQFIEETLKGLETSLNSLIDARTAPEEKKDEPQLRTPRPKAWHERRDEFIASRRDPEFIQKQMAKKTP